MTKETKAKPGTNAELAEMFPLPKQVPVRLARVTGEGADRTVAIEHSKVTIYALPIEQLNRIVQILDPVLSGSEGQRIEHLLTENRAEFYGVVAEATGWKTEDVACFVGNDFARVLDEILQVNADFFARRLGLVMLRLPSVPGRESESTNGPGPKLSASSGNGANRTPSDSPSQPSPPQ